MRKQTILIFIAFIILLTIDGFLIFIFTDNTSNGDLPLMRKRYLLWQVKYNLPIIESAQSEIEQIELPNEKIKLKSLLEQKHIRLIWFEKLPWQTLNRFLYDTVTINIIPTYDCVKKIKHSDASDNDLLNIGVPELIRANCLFYLHEQKTIERIFLELESLFSENKLSEMFDDAIKKLFI
ncbi:hypothetical protein [Spiroplasma endosymbiont of Labia minor]|uniref:hypothetical protein n=1 Tax=Spiroplasma endosymbiont of Labia minor TaxID=3066305 RepID=UPI0030D2C594